MPAQFFAFGEILWDCLPSGRHAGGAPFNVAAHLAQFGFGSALVSAVGEDALGDEILQIATDKGVDASFVSRAQCGLATGTVNVTVDARGDATYEIVQPVAWDQIRVPAEALAAVAQARGLIFGTLAARAPFNREQLDRLLAVEGPLKFFDVNLRAPFDDPSTAIDLARRADVIKLNDAEIGQLARSLEPGEAMPITPRTESELKTACAILTEATGVTRICVTLAAAGAAWWEAGHLVRVPAPVVAVRDTVGAGDAFMAALMIGLTGERPIREVLTAACSVGAYVASQDGAIPRLPRDLAEQILRR